jgi:hypothetical protein
MARKKVVAEERFFSLELRSKDAVRVVTLGNGDGDRVTIEGTVGSLKHVEFVEDSILELVGTAGTLRVDLAKEELMKPAQEPQEGKEL